MAYIKKKSERKFKITVCNGYKVNGQKRMKAQTITVPSSVPKRGIQQYVMAEAERIEKKFKYGVEESDQTHFEQYAENWLKRQKPFFKATTYAGYKRNLGIVYPLIGGIPLAKLLPMTLEEMCEELRKRPGRNGSVKECTVQKYLETVSSVLEDAKKNDIIPFNPAHRVRKKHFEKEVQHIPQKYEMRKLMQTIRDEPILYRAYYTLAITTGLRRGELCALQWRDITGACELTVRRSRSCASGQIVESDTKSHRERILLIHHLRKQAASDPFDQISGSNGLMGAADTTWVMQRKRTSKNADIILTGRDLDRRTLYLHEENCIWLLDEEETAEEQRLKAVPEYLWRVAEYIEQAGKWQGTATELLSAAGVDGVLPHMLTRKIVEHFDTVFAPKGIHYETHRTSQTRLLKFSHSENDADDANDADIDITQLSGWDISKIASQASLASSAKAWREKYGA